MERKLLRSSEMLSPPLLSVCGGNGECICPSHSFRGVLLG